MRRAVFIFQQERHVDLTLEQRPGRSEALGWGETPSFGNVVDDTFVGHEDYPCTSCN
jgi:hypothetical protein